MTDHGLSTGHCSAPRILLVEDAFMVADGVRRQLEALGCVVLDPAPSVEVALEAVECDGFDGAMLDIDLGGQSVLPVVEQLEASGKPFVVVTGFSSPQEMLPDVDQERFFFKPILADEVMRALEMMGLSAGD